MPSLSTTARRSAFGAAAIWVVAAIVIVLAFALIEPFRSPVSINSLLAALAPVLFISTGQAIVVLHGGIDLSVGAVAGMATVILSLAPVLPGGAATALVLALVVGAGVGLANALGTLGGINPLLMTFAMSGVVQGLALQIQKTPGAAIPGGLVRGLNTRLGPVPVLAILAVVVLVTAWWWVSQSRVGRVLVAAGYDPRTAARLGMPVTRSTITAYTVSGILAALGGLAIVTRTFSADALVGTSSVIDSVAVVLVAGIAITGGRGSVLSVIPSALVIAVVGQMILLTGINAQYQTIFKGVLLLAAMGLYAVVRSPRNLAKRLPFLTREATT